MDAHTRAIRSLWKGSAVIYIQVKHVNPLTGRTEFTEVSTGQSFPCRVSYKNISAVESTDTGSKVSQTLVLFMGNEVEVPPGSKIIYTSSPGLYFNKHGDLCLQTHGQLFPKTYQRLKTSGKIIEYSRSGEPAIYSNHQEIQLELFKGWA